MYLLQWKSIQTSRSPIVLIVILWWLQNFQVPFQYTLILCLTPLVPWSLTCDNNARHTHKYMQHDLSTTKGFPSDIRRWNPNLKINTTDISFDEKMANKASKRFLLNTYLYRRQNYAALLAPKMRKPEGKEAVNPEGMDANK